MRTIASTIKRNDTGHHAVLLLDLPAPRVWKPKHLADFLGVSIYWVYKRTEAAAVDPIPRIPGVGRLSFDTHSPAFQEWMRRQLGYVDLGESDE
jgi:hypothetical protein